MNSLLSSPSLLRVLFAKKPVYDIRYTTHSSALLIKWSIHASIKIIIVDIMEIVNTTQNNDDNINKHTHKNNK